MECPHCGAQNAFRAKFCRRCAQRLEMKVASAANAPGAADDVAAVPVAPGRKSNTVILLVLLALVIFGWYFLRPETERPEGPVANPAVATPAAVPPVAGETTVASPVTGKPASRTTAANATVTRPEAPGAAPSAPALSTADPSVGAAEQPAKKIKPVRKPKPVPVKVAEPKLEPARALSTPEPVPVIAQSPPRAGLAAALGACNSRAFLARAICLEQARWKYCQGAWGKTPDCPNPAANDGGG